MFVRIGAAELTSLEKVLVLQYVQMFPFAFSPFNGCTNVQ